MYHSIIRSLLRQSSPQPSSPLSISSSVKKQSHTIRLVSLFVYLEKSIITARIKLLQAHVAVYITYLSVRYKFSHKYSNWLNLSSISLSSVSETIGNAIFPPTDFGICTTTPLLAATDGSATCSISTLD